MEKFDLLDKNRNYAYKQLVRGEKVPEGYYRQVVHIALFNSKGEMLIQQRQPFKKPFPNFWDITIGGSVVSGETSMDGAERELLEELGIEVDFQNARPHMTINFASGFDDYYVLTKDVDINGLSLQESEVQNIKWATKDEIFELIKENKFIPYYKNLIGLLFDFQNKPYGSRDEH